MTALPNPDLVDTLTDLIARLDKVEADLIDLSEEHRPLSHERIRLDSKANGISLARQYVREELTRHAAATQRVDAR